MTKPQHVLLLRPWLSTF